LSEHKRATVQGKKEDSEHACEQSHEPLWNQTKSLAQVPHLGMRLVREALEIRINETSTINRNDGKDISRMWRSLFSNNQ
jgi:hypothetical protein